MTENYSTACATLTRVNKICDSTNNEMQNNYNNAIKRNEAMQEKICNEIHTLKNKVKTDLEKVTFIFLLIFILHITKNKKSYFK